MATEQIGEVVAVCLSDRKDFPKYPQPSVEVYTHGIRGDAHSGPRRPSHKNPKEEKDNDRTVSLVADEVRQQVNTDLGLDIQPGGFNENILVKGLDDLGQLKGGDRLIFSTGVVLRITEQNGPCTILEAYHAGAPLITATAGKNELGEWNKRGVVATIVLTGELSPGVLVKVRSIDEA